MGVLLSDNLIHSLKKFFIESKNRFKNPNGAPNNKPIVIEINFRHTVALLVNYLLLFFLSLPTKQLKV